MHDLAVIVVSHNSARWLEPCLSSTYAHAGSARLDVIVVDNGSSDGSPELVERCFPQARIERCPNRGFAAGNNVGLRLAKASFVLFLNPDTEILRGDFGEMLRLLETRPSVGLVGCRQVDASGSLAPTIRRFPSAARYFFEALGSERLPFDGSWLGERVRDSAVYERETPCDWTSGSFMLARRDAVVAAGGMDERYFLYSEEPDLCLRLKRLGWETRHLPAMTIRHHLGNSWNERLVAQDAHARRQYMAKNMGRLQMRIAMLAFGFRHLLRAGYVTRDATLRKARRRCARAALLTLFGKVQPPFQHVPTHAPSATCAVAAASASGGDHSA